MSEAIKILVIDDSEDDRLVYRRTLEKHPGATYMLFEADNGDDGIKRIAETGTDFVLLDYSLPGRNGVEVLKRIRSQHPFIPVVMLTGQGNESVAVAAMREGAQNYMVKSAITPETLNHVIHMAIEHCMMQKRIHEQRNSLEVFTRALAHDLKEPVRTIRSFAELIGQYETLSDKARGHFQHIEKAAERMNMLIDTVFLYTRLDDPGQMTREKCDMATVLKAVEENAAQLIRERRATIKSNTLPAVFANRTQMMQLLQNLVCNAINHSEKPVTVSVSAIEEADQWRFRVADNGPGIEAAYLEKIFEPFKRFAHGKTQGSGLGLAICRKIIESYGGKIWCEPTPGKGATFLFTLPKNIPAEKDQTAATAAKSAGSAPQTNGKTLANVLLVDDSRADIEMTRFRLLERSQLQCNFIVARDGEEAIAKLSSRTAEDGPIDLMLLDINMPEMDGFELLERIRADNALKATVVVMCTGSIYDKDMARAISLGARGYLTKPVEFQQLKSVIDKTDSIQLQAQDKGFALLRVA